MARTKYTIGSDNVFADLGIPDSDEYLDKATLAVRINEKVAELRLTQKAAAELLQVDQPKVSLLKRGVLDAFSIGRLMRFLRLLGDPHEVLPRRAKKATSNSVFISGVASKRRSFSRRSTLLSSSRAQEVGVTGDYSVGSSAIGSILPSLNLAMQIPSFRIH